MLVCFLPPFFGYETIYHKLLILFPLGVVLHWNVTFIRFDKQFKEIIVDCENMEWAYIECIYGNMEWFRISYIKPSTACTFDSQNAPVNGMESHI